MVRGIQIKTFKFKNKLCDEIDREVNDFLKNVVDKQGNIIDVEPLINYDGTVVMMTVKYVDGVY
ncbi:hypothetical protein [Clostridium sulfidigenes]|uniref:hypothetical protein n=1 Tax=Clostridium sulfidigenes TaxID=318464 RepID=UPI003F8AA013